MLISLYLLGEIQEKLQVRELESEQRKHAEASDISYEFCPPREYGYPDKTSRFERQGKEKVMMNTQLS